jgi:mannosyltransferase
MERTPSQTVTILYRGDQIGAETVNLASRPDVSGPEAPISGLVLVALLAGALAIRGAFIWDDRLWLDEVWSATFAVQSLPDVIIATLRFDPHPPLYYLQLWLWSAISHSTVWLFANSLFWSWLTVLSTYYVTWKLTSPRIALITTVLLAVMPEAVGLAHSLRMYPMIACLSVWVWYHGNRCLLSTPGWKNGGVLVTLLLLVSYSHATGPLIIGYSGVFGLCLAWQERLARRQVLYWIKVHVLAGILGLPVLINSLIRSTSHTITPGVWDVMRTFADLAAGPVISTHAWAFIPVSILTGLAILVACFDRKLRPMVGGFLLMPFSFGALVSYVVAPIWLDRVFFFTVPFLAVALANSVLTTGRLMWSHTRGHAARATIAAAASIFVAALAGLSLYQFGAVPKPTNYKAAAAVITSQSQQGDLVYIPSNVTYWGIVWYAVGPDWGSPLAIQGNSGLDCDDRWCAVLEYIGPVWRQRLHLEPKTRVIARDGVPFYVGHVIPTEALSAQRVWVVHNSNQPPALSFNDYKVSQEWKDGRGITVQLLTR